MTASPQAMACPVDGTALVMSERQGIEIDYCPACRGVWLDRGELDKIVQRGGDESQSAPAPHAPDRWSSGRQEPHDYRRKRRKSFFEDLFD